jgi:hypothetical protein
MNAFQGNPKIQAAFVRANGRIAHRVEDPEYFTRLRGTSQVSDIAGFVLQGLEAKEVGRLNYSHLELPDKVIALVLAILYHLRHRRRVSWLLNFFRSIPPGADLEEKKVWARYLRKLLLERILPEPQSKSKELRDKLLRQARTAINNAIRLANSPAPADWPTAKREVDTAKELLTQYVEEGGTVNEGATGYPTLSTVYLVLDVVAQPGNECDLKSIHNLGMAVNNVISYRQQAAFLLSLVSDNSDQSAQSNGD